MGEIPWKGIWVGEIPWKGIWPDPQASVFIEAAEMTVDEISSILDFMQDSGILAALRERAARGFEDADDEGSDQ